MKKCPYCAEEIQDDAVFCRFCRRRVRGISFGRILIFTILTGLLIFTFTHRKEIHRFNRNAQHFFRNLDNYWASFKEMVKEAGRGLAAIRNYREQQEELEEQYEVLKQGEGGEKP